MACQSFDFQEALNFSDDQSSDKYQTFFPAVDNFFDKFILFKNLGPKQQNPNSSLDGSSESISDLGPDDNT